MITQGDVDSDANEEESIGCLILFSIFSISIFSIYLFTIKIQIPNKDTKPI